jgi:hypothetical protein
MQTNHTPPASAQDDTHPSNQHNTPRSNAPETIGVYDRPKSPLLAQPLLLKLVILFLIALAVLFVLFVVL